MHTRRRLTMATLVALALTLPLTALAQDYPVQAGTITVDLGTPDDTSPGGGGTPPQTSSGGSVWISAGGFEPGSTVSIYMESEPILLATTVADAQGYISVTVLIPVDAEVGEHTLKATGSSPTGGAVVLTQQIAVLAQTDLPYTGFPVARYGLTGVAALGVGLIAVLVYRRSRSAA